MFFKVSVKDNKIVIEDSYAVKLIFPWIFGITYLNVFFFGGKFGAQLYILCRFHAVQLYVFSTSNSLICSGTAYILDKLQSFYIWILFKDYLKVIVRILI